jgi:hypothetical protein
MGVAARFVRNCTLHLSVSRLPFRTILKEGFETGKPIVCRWVAVPFANGRLQRWPKPC